MIREPGTYQTTSTHGETVRAFIPHPLPTGQRSVRAADDGVRVARAIHALLGTDRQRLAAHDRATVAAIRLLGTTAPPARKAIELLEHLGILRETTGKQRDRVYAYHAYLDLLTHPAASGDAGNAGR